MYTKEQLADKMDTIIGFLNLAEAASRDIVDPAMQQAVEALTQAIAGVALIVTDTQGLRANPQDD